MLQPEIALRAKQITAPLAGLFGRLYRSFSVAALFIGLFISALPVAGAADEKTLQVGGMKAQAGTRARFALRLTETFGGTAIDTSVEVVHGQKLHPVVCLIGGVHGDEIDGIEVVRRIQQKLDPASVQATVVTIPLLNVVSFENRSRYLSDRRDLNRSFPGSERGSMAARIAHRLMRQVIEHCTVLIDVHGGSDRRFNLPQIRADMRDNDTAALANALEPLIVLHSVPGAKTLRAAAHDQGVVAVTVELGEANRLDHLAIETVVASIEGMLARLPSKWRDCRAIVAGNVAPEDNDKRCATAMYFRSTSWLRAHAGGVFIARQPLGARVKKGQVLASVVDIHTHESALIVASKDGLIVGRAVDQVVRPGFGLFHIASDEALLSASPLQSPSDTR